MDIVLAQRRRMGTRTHDAQERQIPQAEGGVIFSDGIEADFLEFNAGARAVVDVAARRGRLVQ